MVRQACRLTNRCIGNIMKLLKWLHNMKYCQNITKISGNIENSTETIYPILSGIMMFGEYPQAFLPQLYRFKIDMSHVN